MDHNTINDHSCNALIALYILIFFFILNVVKSTEDKVKFFTACQNVIALT